MVGLVIGQQVHGVSPAMQRAQDEAEIRTLTAQVSELRFWPASRAGKGFAERGDDAGTRPKLAVVDVGQ